MEMCCIGIEEVTFNTLGVGSFIMTNARSFYSILVAFPNVNAFVNIYDTEMWCEKAVDFIPFYLAVRKRQLIYRIRHQKYTSPKIIML